MTTQHVLISIHIIAISVWVGGMIVVGAIIPTVVRTITDQVIRNSVTSGIGRSFNIATWSALLVALLTGMFLFLDSQKDAPADCTRHFGEKPALTAVFTGVRLSG